MRLIALGTTALLATASLSVQADTYNIDPAHTYPYFEISHLGFSTLRGRFDSTKGKIDVDLKAKTGSVDVTIDAASVSTGFQKRDDHLRSPDFLNAPEFPEIKFKSTKVTFQGDSKATVDGDLTIKGVTKPVKLEVSSIVCGTNPLNKKEVCGFDATTSFKRSDFGITYGLPAIGDDMKIMLEVEGNK